MIPKGSIIRIGREGVVPSAVDLEFKVQHDTDWGKTSKGKVTKDPNGWGNDEVRHTLRKGIDQIVFSDPLRGRIIPKGSIIRIGQNQQKTVNETAVGLEFVLTKDAEWGSHTGTCQVSKNPNGWRSKTVSHRLNQSCDKIVSIAGLSCNKDAVQLLRKDDPYVAN